MMNVQEFCNRMMKQETPYFVMLFLVFLFSISFTGQGITAEPQSTKPVTLTLDELIQIALTNNPQYEAAVQQRMQREGQLTQARSFYLPQVSVNGQYSRVNVDEMQPVEEDNVVYGGAKVSQLIFDFGKTTGAIDAGRSNLDASTAALELTSQGIVFLVKQAYYNMLEKKHLIRVAQQAVSNYEKHLDRAQEYFEAGVRTRIDVVNAEVELSSAKLRLLRSRYKLKSARVDLERVLGLVPNNGQYDLNPVLDDLDRVNATLPPLPGELEHLLARAAEQRQDIQQQQAFVKTAKAFIRQADSGYWPSIGASAGFDDYETDLAGFQDQWNVGVGLNWELFAGFRTKGEIAEAKALHRENLYRLHDLELQVKQEVTDGLIRADENRESVFLNLETVKLATENLELASERYKAGLNDMIEYNDAELRYTSAKGELVSSYFAYLTSLARVDFVIGTPAPQVMEQ